MKKRFFAIILSLALVLALLTACAGGASAPAPAAEQPAAPAEPAPAPETAEEPETASEDFDTVTIKIASTKTANQDVGAAAEKFVEMLKERLGDKADVQLYLGGQLYSASEQVQALMSNEVQLVFDISTVLQTVDNQLDILLLPGIFGNRDVSTIYDIIDSEEAHDVLMSNLESKDIQMLALVNGGTIIISNNTRALETPADCVGLKIRAAGAVESQIVTAFGASTMVTENSETYSALQQGLVDGVFNPIKIFKERSFFETNKHVTNLGYIYFPTNFLAANKTWLAGQPQAVQDVIYECAGIIQENLRSNVSNVDAESFAAVEAARCEVTVPADMQPWIDAASTVVDKYYDEIGKEAIESFKAIVEKH